MTRAVRDFREAQRYKKILSVMLGAALALGATGHTLPARADETADLARDPVAHLVHFASERLCDRAQHPKARFLCKARRLINSDGTHKITPRAPGMPSGYGPADLQAAYALDPTRGAGMTVAIADAFGYSQAEADLAAYRSMYGLPACTSASGCFKVVGQDGGAPPADPTNSQDAQWNGEAALDVDMVSAACPLCKIILILSNNDQDDGLEIAQQTAATLGANVVSDSWGGPDDTPLMEEHYFQTTPPIGIFVASGDAGYDNQDSGQSGPDYPSTSLFAVGVGGTALKRAAGTTRGWSELPWGEDSHNGAAGSSCSTTIAKPSYQKTVVPDSACMFRAASDTAAVASPNTGVAVYQSGWSVIGGTSVASPFVAAVFAMTGRALAGPSFPYENPSDFYDVSGGTTANSNDSTGACGAPLCVSGVGWDGQTGMGTPNGAAMTPPPPDMATPLDLATPDDLAAGKGHGNGDGGSGGKDDGGCGCSLGGAPSGHGLLAIPLALALLGLALYRRRRVS
jgi:MYXO-CTERM domain-containing protein